MKKFNAKEIQIVKESTEECNAFIDKILSKCNGQEVRFVYALLKSIAMGIGEIADDVKESVSPSLLDIIKDFIYKE